ncbi:hypothetical protein L208DRAFT_1323642 [Tricholoma matsutake]|nr:hypothetical protein L208DRAFT_1323642 [Tricholoma matsutake 945]
MRLLITHALQLQTVTLDNASNNNTSCETIEHQHNCRLLEWSANENQLPCLEHIVNLANVAVMTHITKIAAIENANAIWEYDLELPGNQVLGGSLDVVAAIRTLTVKIQSSGQCIEYFQKLQLQCKIVTLLKIPLHGNTRWGSAHKMLDGSYKLRQVSTTCSR